VSADGERVVFAYGGALYLRENAGQEPSELVTGSTQVNGEQCSELAKACTVQLDVSHGLGSSGGGEFWGASADGSRIFFTDQSQLTGDSTAAFGKPDLYEYEAETGQLTDITVNVGEPANVKGVAGVSEDGAYVYFVAWGVLTGKPNDRGATPEKRSFNLYLYHAGETTFIATLNVGDRPDWAVSAANAETQSVEFRSTVVSPDGGLIAFNSIVPLTGYNNAPAEPQDCYGTESEDAAGKPCNEIFLYDAAADRLSCVSCGRRGSHPTGMAELRSAEGTFARRALSGDGSVFFDTPSPLLGQDVNGVYDVYEWSPAGVGECEASSATFQVGSDGCLYSLSSGASPEPSYFVDASESGEDAYFVTSQGLVQSDTDNGLSLYDARVNGGFPPGAGEVLEGSGCESPEACKPPPSEAPAQLFVASSALTASGNLAAPPVPLTPTQPTVETAVKGGLTRAQQLAQALRACSSRPKRARSRCRAQAYRRYGTPAKEKTKTKAKTKTRARAGLRGKDGQR